MSDNFMKKEEIIRENKEKNYRILENSSRNIFINYCINSSFDKCYSTINKKDNKILNSCFVKNIEVCNHVGKVSISELKKYIDNAKEIEFDYN